MSVIMVALFIYIVYSTKGKKKQGYTPIDTTSSAKSPNVSLEMIEVSNRSFGFSSPVSLPSSSASPSSKSEPTILNATLENEPIARHTRS